MGDSNTCAAGIRSVGATPPSGVAGVSVRVEAADVSRLCDSSLRSRLAEIGRAQSQLTAMKAAVLTEITHRTSSVDAEYAAVQTLAVSGRSARNDVKAAATLGELPVTRNSLAAGTLPTDHAQLIARAATDSTVNEHFLVERAQRETFDVFRRTVARHVADQSSDDGAALLERQRQQRSARVFTSRENSMVVIKGQFDSVPGARLAAAVAAVERDLYRNEDPLKRPTAAQRTADAITKLICQPTSTQPARTTLVVVADYDTINHKLTNSRFADGTPIPISKIADIAVEAELLPSIFRAATGELRMGRCRRTATETQRIALAVRDQGCIGCGAPPHHCDTHHIVHWQHGGPTNLDNLTLVCHRCHHTKIHEHNYTVERDPTSGRYTLQPPSQPQATKTRATETRATKTRAPPAI